MKTDELIIGIVIVFIMVFCTGYFIFGFMLPTQDAFDKFKDRLEHHDISRADTIYIESLKDGSTISGRFVLGSGYINGRDVSIYYTTGDDGGYTRNNVDADVSKIYMDENTKPYIVCHYVETDRLKQQFIHSYDFHVPNGTVMNTYRV
jgi:hypothetical protein